MEVIEHLDPPRLPALEDAVFGHARPGHGGRDDAERRVQRALRGTGRGRLRHPTTGSSGPGRSSPAGPSAVAGGTATGSSSAASATDDPEVGPPTQLAPCRHGDAMTDLDIPDLSLVVLVGVSGSGKSTFAARHFKPTQVLSSDFCRAWSPTTRTTSPPPGTPSTCCTTSPASGCGRPPDRRRRHQRAAAGPRRSWSGWPGSTTCCRSRSCSTCRRRCARSATRPGRTGQFGRACAAAASSATCAGRCAHWGARASARCTSCAARGGRRRRRSLRAAVQRPARPHRAVRHHRRHARLPRRAGDPARRARLGPGPRRRRAAGRATHPEGRTAVFVGDLVDRGPDTPGVLRLVMGMVARRHRAVRAGQPREQAAAQAARPQGAASRHGLAETAGAAGGRAGRSSCRGRPAFIDGLVSHYVLDGGRLVVATPG